MKLHRSQNQDELIRKIESKPRGETKLLNFQRKIANTYQYYELENYYFKTTFDEQNEYSFIYFDTDCDEISRKH